MSHSQEYIDIHITGQYNGHPLSRRDFDISDVSEMLGVLSRLFSVSQKWKDKLPVEYLDGSVRFRLLASKMRCALASAMLGLISNNYNLDGIERNIAEQVEWIQNRSKETGLSFEITTSQKDARLSITPATTYNRADGVLVDTELYLYGVVVRAGGKDSVSIQLLTDDYGILNIRTGQDVLREKEDNLLYHECGVWVRGKQDIATDELTSLVLIELLDFTTKYNDSYLDGCIKRATPAWADVTDIDGWLDEVRGTI